MTDTNGLHLPDLTIQGFRGIDKLSIPRLGRVTLLAGRNSVGKTTVLDAVQVYAARGRYEALVGLLHSRSESTVVNTDNGQLAIRPDWETIFNGRAISPDSYISIGPADIEEQLIIQPTRLNHKEAKFVRNTKLIRPMHIDLAGETRTHALEVRYANTRRIFLLDISLSYPNSDEPPPEIRTQYLGPAPPTNNDLADLWDGVALTDHEERAVDALGLIFGTNVNRVAVVGDNLMGDSVLFLGHRGRRMVARLKGHKQPVPLASLGDGALRLFGVAIALANSRNGFMLIDEAENGIHHSIQRDYWRMVLQTAHENNVQVLATTHSWDCVTGFAQAATELEDVEGVLVRLSRSNGDLRAIEYPEEELATAAEQGIEVR